MPAFFLQENMKSIMPTSCMRESPLPCYSGSFLRDQGTRATDRENTGASSFAPPPLQMRKKPYRPTGLSLAALKIQFDHAAPLIGNPVFSVAPAETRPGAVDEMGLRELGSLSRSFGVAPSKWELEEAVMGDKKRDLSLKALFAARISLFYKANYPVRSQRSYRELPSHP